MRRRQRWILAATRGTRTALRLCHQQQRSLSGSDASPRAAVGGWAGGRGGVGPQAGCRRRDAAVRRTPPLPSPEKSSWRALRKGGAGIVTRPGRRDASHCRAAGPAHTAYDASRASGGSSLRRLGGGGSGGGWPARGARQKVRRCRKPQPQLRRGRSHGAASRAPARGRAGASGGGRCATLPPTLTHSADIPFRCCHGRLSTERGGGGEHH